MGDSLWGGMASHQGKPECLTPLAPPFMKFKQISIGNAISMLQSFHLRGLGARGVSSHSVGQGCSEQSLSAGGDGGASSELKELTQTR